MNQSLNLFVTGITGTVGNEILRYLMQHHRNDQVYFLIRSSSQNHLKLRWDRVLSTASDNTVAVDDIPNFKPVSGNIIEENLGLEESIKEHLVNHVTHIIHAAGNISFTAPFDISRRDNVDGTRHVLDFAQACKNLKQLAHISTIFVAGKRSGSIFENELEHDEGFASTYEQTKYEAEILVRKRMSQLPLAMYRLALLPGRSDGYIHHYGVFHQGLQFYYYGLIPVFPGDKDAFIDLCPADQATNTLMDLFLKNFEHGRTYHICRGSKAIPMHRLAEIMTEVYSETLLAWKRGDHSIPDFVNESTYKLFEKSVIETQDSTFLKVVKIMNTMIPHLLNPKQFQNPTFVKLNENSMCTEEFFKKVLHTCVASDWGRKVVAQKEIAYDKA